MSSSVEAVGAYVAKVAQLGANEIAREHSYRPALVQLFNALAPAIETFNDPARSKGGQPDFVFVQKSNAEIVRGYGEAKDLGGNLDKVERTDQLLRYAGYDRLLLTNELEFRFYREGERYANIKIAEQTKSGDVLPLVENFQKFIEEFLEFIALPPVRITSATKLATTMGGKARRVRDYVKDALAHPERRGDDDILKVFEIVKRNLVSRMDGAEFADMYAQTLIYGLFSARYSDTTLDTFTRQEARDLIPAETPFLRSFFDHVAGSGFSQGLAQIVSEMCEVFRVSDVATIVHRQLATHDDDQGRDPIIHFYEDFLREYDANQRKKRGAYYTPTPVVRFIVRAVDKVLKEDLGIPEGLADSGRKQITVPAQPGLMLKPGNKRRTPTSSMTVDVHRLQILDFATGTATFLNEVIKHVHRGFAGQEGLWPDYAAEDLVPRLNGFELMMAPYAIAHMKLGMTLTDLGVTRASKFRVYLTNTLEKPHTLNPDLFQVGLLDALTEEAAAASEVKDQRPIMVVIGNPPYSGVSANNFKYANAFVKKYKVEPGGKLPLNERNSKWLNNDYVKFIGFAEELIAKNGHGVIGVITDNSYLMSPTFRGMRWHLANTFDKLMILDLHGRKIPGDNPDLADDDQNVFDIMQGVSILIAVKNGTKPDGTLADVLHSELLGKRKAKFDALDTDDVSWEKLDLNPSTVYFKPTSADGHAGYSAGVSLDDIFHTRSVGIAAGRDAITIGRTQAELRERLTDFMTLDEESAKDKYGIKKEGEDWKVAKAQADLGNSLDNAKFIPITYRPFDQRWTYYTGTTGGIHTRPRDDTSRHMIGRDNLALCYSRRIEQKRPFADALVTNHIIQFHSLSIKESNYFAPLYVVDSDGTRYGNYKPEAVKRLIANLEDAPSDRDLFDYIYGVLNDPQFRSNNDEALHLDYPRIPVAQDVVEFEAYRAFGHRMIGIHTMSDSDVLKVTTTFPESGDNRITQYKFEAGRIWINEGQYFGNVSADAWGFLVGSYNPALKWLKDRKGTKLTSDDIRHYQRVLNVLELSVIQSTAFVSPQSEAIRV